MRAVWWKELRELGILVIVLAGAGGWFAKELTDLGRDQSDEILVLGVIGGLAIGVLHGAFDRRRREDHFLMHRPLSAERMQLARSLAGLAACGLVVVVFLVALHVFTVLRWLDFERYKASMGLFLPKPYFHEASTQVAACVYTCASWAVVRFAIGTGRVFLLLVLVWMLPVAWAMASRVPATPWGAAFYAAGFLLLFGTLHLLQQARTRRRLRAALTLVVLAAVWLEGSLLLRVRVGTMQRDAYPFFGMMPSGEIRYWRWSEAGEEELDSDRVVVKRWPAHERRKPSAAVLLRARVSLDRKSAVWNRAARMTRVRPGQSAKWWTSLVGYLNGEEASRRNARFVRWDFHRGRFRCRGPDGDVLAGFGPDGYTLGPVSVEGARFGRLVPIGGGIQSLVPDFSTTRPGETPDRNRSQRATYVDEEHWSTVAVRWNRKPRGSMPARSKEPLRVEVATNPVDADDGTHQGLAFYGLGRKVMLIRYGGAIVARFDLDERETAVRAYGAGALGPLLQGLGSYGVGGGPVGLRTILPPAHPTRHRTRLRFFQPDGRRTTQEVDFEPVSFGEHVLAGGLGVIALARPLPLNIASSVTTPPATPGEMRRWWWRDPLLAGGSDFVWLLFSVVVAACCAWRARRSARARCDSKSKQHFWTVAALMLGPLGLVWMRIVVGRVVVREVGDGARAVDLDATPDNDAPWPEPQPTGTEVFG